MSVSNRGPYDFVLKSRLGTFVQSFTFYLRLPSKTQLIVLIEKLNMYKTKKVKENEKRDKNRVQMSIQFREMKAEWQVITNLPEQRKLPNGLSQWEANTLNSKIRGRCRIWHSESLHGVWPKTAELAECLCKDYSDFWVLNTVYSMKRINLKTLDNGHSCAEGEDRSCIPPSPNEI